MTSQNYKKLVAWQRYDGLGNPIPGTMCYKPLNITPKDGIWKKVNGSLCCGQEDSLLIVQNNSTDAQNTGATVTSVISSDGTIKWSGVIAQSGGMLGFVIPNGYDMTLSISVASGSTLTDTIDVTTSTISGAGTISAASPSNLSGSTKTTVLSTSATPSSQYLVILADS